MIDLYDVRIEKFISSTQGDLTRKIYVDPESVKHITGILVDDNVIDINTQESYYLLKRTDDERFIDKSELEKIEYDKYYAIEATPCSKSVLQSIRANLVAKKTKMPKVIKKTQNW